MPRQIFVWKAVLLGGLVLAPLTLAVAAEDYVRAKVGIQVRSGEQATSAKASDTIKMGDSLRVYAIPEEDAYVYVVHSDGKKVTLLNESSARTKVDKGSTVFLPTREQFYKVDGMSDKESITVICSPRELPAIPKAVQTERATSDAWLAMEKELVEKSKLEMGENINKPFQLAGNVRSVGESDPFVQTLPIFSGKSLVVKKYAFQVQK